MAPPATVFKRRLDNIKIGSSNIRNPIIATFVAKGLLPYRGLGYGITRALHAWKNIDFIDDRKKCTFTAIIHRKSIDEYKTSVDKIKDDWAALHSIPLIRIWEEDIRKSPEKVMKLLKARFYIEDDKAVKKTEKNKRHVNKLKKL